MKRIGWIKFENEDESCSVALDKDCDGKSVISYFKNGYWWNLGDDEWEDMDDEDEAKEGFKNFCINENLEFGMIV